MTYRCTVCGARVAMTPENWQCIDPSCGETWPLLSNGTEDTGDSDEDEDSEPPTEDRIPESERIAARERQLEDDGRAERSRLGLDR